MQEVVVALFPIGPKGPTTQGGHLRNPTHPTRTWCDKEVVDKNSTVATLRCTACHYLSTRSGSTIPPAPQAEHNTKEQDEGT